MSRLFSNLRFRLFLLLLLAIIPTVGLRLYTYLEQKQLATIRAKEEAMRMAQLVSSSQSQLIEEARNFLYMLAQVSEVRSCDRRQCRTLFAIFLKQYPRYLNISVASSDGNIFASAHPLTKPVNVSNCSCFRSALQTRRFSIGKFVIGPIEGKPIVSFAYPVTDGSGNLKSVLFVALDLTWLNHLAKQTQLPQGSTLTLIDEDGTVLARHPDGEKWAGKTMQEAPIVRTILSQGKGMAEGVGIDGVPSLYAFAPFGSTAAAGNIYVSIAIPKSVAYAEVNRILIRNLVLLTIGLIVLGAIWFGADLLVFQRLNHLVQVSKRLGAGHLSARTGIAHGKGELNQLASTFDEMATSLERRESEMIKSEEALRRSEKKYRELTDLLPEVVYETDEKGNLTFVNQQAFGALGYTEEDFRQGLNIFQMIVVEERDIAREKLSKALNEEKLNHEHTLLRKDGSMFPGIVHATPILRDGHPSGLRGIVIDITDRKRMEEALRESEERYRTIFNTTGTATIILEEDTTISLVNAEFEKLSGYSREEVEGKRSWTEFVDKDFLETMIKEYHHVRRVNPNSAPVSYESSFIDKQGNVKEFIITVSMIPGTKKSVTSFFDITERKRAEKGMADLQEQLRQSQKMEAIGRLAGGVAHDFNNALTVIKGYSQLALGELRKEDPLRESIAEIQKASERAADLTHQLLAFSRRQIFEMKVLNLNNIIQDFQKMLSRLLGEDIQLVTALADDLGRVKTDVGQIEQVLMNLAVNARDAMPKGGKLTIETVNVTLDEEFASKHIGVNPGSYVMLSVSDTGYGMTHAVKERIFEPFFTTKEKGKGTGLGLSTVYGIVKQSEGNIWVYSDPGQGTTFKICLPRVEELPEGLLDKVRDEAVPRGNETVLIVEDDEPVRKLAALILEKQGYTVLEAHQAYEALSLCKERKTPIHLVLTDVVMPEMSGRELVKNLKQVRQDFKVLYMSGYTDDAIVHHGVLDKGVDFIQKPFTLQGLTRKVRDVLDK